MPITAELQQLNPLRNPLFLKDVIASLDPGPARRAGWLSQVGVGVFWRWYIPGSRTRLNPVDLPIGAIDHYPFNGDAMAYLFPVLGFNYGVARAIAAGDTAWLGSDTRERNSHGLLMGARIQDGERGLMNIIFQNESSAVTTSDGSHRGERYQLHFQIDTLTDN